MKPQSTLTEKEQELVSLLIGNCKTTGDIHAKLKQLFAGTVEQMLEAEMEEHLGYEKHSVVGEQQRKQPERLQQQNHHQRLRRDNNPCAS